MLPAEAKRLNGAPDSETAWDGELLTAEARKNNHYGKHVSVPDSQLLPIDAVIQLHEGSQISQHVTDFFPAGSDRLNHDGKQTSSPRANQRAVNADILNHDEGHVSIPDIHHRAVGSDRLNHDGDGSTDTESELLSADSSRLGHAGDQVSAPDARTTSALADKQNHTANRSTLIDSGLLSVDGILLGHAVDQISNPEAALLIPATSDRMGHDGESKTGVTDFLFSVDSDRMGHDGAEASIPDGRLFSTPGAKMSVDRHSKTDRQGWLKRIPGKKLNAEHDHITEPDGNLLPSADKKLNMEDRQETAWFGKLSLRTEGKFKGFHPFVTVLRGRMTLRPIPQMDAESENETTSDAKLTSFDRRYGVHLGDQVTVSISSMGAEISKSSKELKHRDNYNTTRETALYTAYKSRVANTERADFIGDLKASDALTYPKVDVNTTCADHVSVQRAAGFEANRYVFVSRHESKHEITLDTSDMASYGHRESRHLGAAASQVDNAILTASTPLVGMCGCLQIVLSCQAGLSKARATGLASVAPSNTDAMADMFKLYPPISIDDRTLYIRQVRAVTEIDADTIHIT